jgi:hypothetical protein
LKRLLALFAVLCSTVLPAFAQTVTGADGHFPISLTVKDAGDKPIKETRVSLVLLPKGGIDDLTKAVDHYWPLLGWNYKTDISGHVTIKEVPKGRPKFDKDLLAVAISEGVSSIDFVEADEAHSLQYEEYAPGQKLAVVVDIPDQEPWIGLVEPDLAQRTFHFDAIRGRALPYVGRTFVLGSPSYAPASPSREASSFVTDHGASTAGAVYVHGYMRKDGTYVAAHHRSRPDGNFYNNWSTKGNFNPFTGKMGTKVSPSGSRSASSDTSSGGSVYVHGYTRKDGTHVKAHTRSRPHK